MTLFPGWQVESLTAARKASQAGTEPSDAIRVVNSVLTQLDQIKRLVNGHLLCLTYSMMSEVLFTLLWSPSAAFKLLVFLNVFTTFVFQTFQCRDPNNFQRDGEDWLGICGQSWHQAVYRTPLCERHIQHLPLLSGGAHEGEHCRFNNCVNPKFLYTLICGAGEVFAYIILGLHTMLPMLMASFDLFKTGSAQIFVKIHKNMCVQCKIIYPREQLFTIFELETMGFAESEVSAHSLILRHIAVWVMDLQLSPLSNIPT